MNSRSIVHRFRVVLQYHKFPAYLLKNYETLLDEASIHFLYNPEILAARVENSNVNESDIKLMMTEFEKKN